MTLTGVGKFAFTQVAEGTTVSITCETQSRGEYRASCTDATIKPLREELQRLLDDANQYQDLAVRFARDADSSRGDAVRFSMEAGLETAKALKDVGEVLTKGTVCFDTLGIGCLTFFKEADDWLSQTEQTSKTIVNALNLWQFYRSSKVAEKAARRNSQEAWREAVRVAQTIYACTEEQELAALIGILNNSIQDEEAVIQTIDEQIAEADHEISELERMKEELDTMVELIRSIRSDAAEACESDSYNCTETFDLP